MADSPFTGLPPLSKEEELQLPERFKGSRAKVTNPPGLTPEEAWKQVTKFIIIYFILISLLITWAVWIFYGQF